MNPTIFAMCTALSQFTAPPEYPAFEGSVVDGKVLVVTNTHTSEQRMKLVSIGAAGVDTAMGGVSSHELVCGPVPWGVSDGFYYGATTRRMPEAFQTTMFSVISVHGVDDLFGLAATNGGVDPEAAKEYVRRLNAIQDQHSRRIGPLEEFVKEHSDELTEEWSLHFDVTFVTREVAIAVATFDGRLYAWESRLDRGLQWEPTVEIETELTGPFRVFVRNGDLVFIDQAGAVYYGLGDHHRLVARIQGWPTELEQDETCILLQHDQSGPIVPCRLSTNTAEPMTIDWIDDSARGLLESDVTDSVRDLLRQCHDVLRAGT